MYVFMDVFECLLSMYVYPLQTLVPIVPSCNCILFLSLLQLLMKEKRETKDMKDEAEKYQKTLQELADHEIQEKLFKLFHAEQDIQLAEGELKEKQQELSDLVRGGEGEGLHIATLYTLQYTRVQCMHCIIVHNYTTTLRILTKTIATYCVLVSACCVCPLSLAPSPCICSPVAVRRVRTSSR